MTPQENYAKWLKKNLAFVDMNRSDKDDLFSDGMTANTRTIQTIAEQTLTDALVHSSNHWRQTNV